MTESATKKNQPQQSAYAYRPVSVKAKIHCPPVTSYLKKKIQQRAAFLTKPCTLSPQLAQLVGQETMLGPDVIKKIWSIIKEQHLEDHENKYVTICKTDAMRNVFGVDRFPTMQMMQYLKCHLGIALDHEKRWITNLMQRIINERDITDLLKIEKEHEGLGDDVVHDTLMASSVRQNKAETSMGRSSGRLEGDNGGECSYIKTVKPIARRVRQTMSGSDTDDDWLKQSRNRTGQLKKKKPKKYRHSGGYERSCVLSPALAKLVGQDSMPWCQVVQRIWAIIKERDLFDPTNKQFIVCRDEDMRSVFGVDRFRVFGMTKYLKDHFRKSV